MSTKIQGHSYFSTFRGLHKLKRYKQFFNFNYTQRFNQSGIFILLQQIFDEYILKLLELLKLQ